MTVAQQLPGFEEFLKRTGVLKGIKSEKMSDTNDFSIFKI